MLYYNLQFEAGAEIVTFRAVKNFKIGAHIASVIRSNFPNFQQDFVVYDVENGKTVHNKDSVCDGCIYSVVRPCMNRSRCPATASTVKKYTKKYRFR
jgi:hypothetical protein